MSPTIKELCISSFNSTGFGIGIQNYMTTLLSFSDILCVQEHFLLDSNSKKNSNTDKLKNYFGDAHDAFVVPAVKCNNTINRGRGKGGLAVIWKKHLTKYVTKVPWNNFRLQAIKFSLPQCEFLLINSYFPCDPQTENFDDSELLNVLADLKSLTKQSKCHNVLLAADLNCHFSRETYFTTLVADSMNDLNLSVLWDHPDFPVDYTYCNIANDTASFSTIDHFAISPMLEKVVIEAGVVHSGENTSNHEPIYIKIKVEQINLKLDKEERVTRSNWSNATSDSKEAFKSCLAQKLTSLPKYICTACHDIMCNDPLHLRGIEDYTLDVLKSMEEAGNECLPSTTSTSRRRHGIPGWSQHVKPYADESKFWYALWLSAGKPLNGELFLNMKLSNKQYKFAVRRLKRCADIIQNEKMANCLLNSEGNIFQEVKKIRGNRTNYSSQIDETIGAENIANHFASIYKNLYNSVNLDDEFGFVKTRVQQSIDDESKVQYSRITENTVRKAINLLKAKKSDAYFNISSDFYLNGPDELVTHLTHLMQLYFCHGWVPQVALMCTLIPLVNC